MEISELSELQFTSLTPQKAAEHFGFFFARPNKCCDSIPIDFVFWQKIHDTRFCLAENECLMIIRKERNEPSAVLPLCREELFPRYFTVMKDYFNKVLGIPMTAHWCEEEGIKLLRENGLIDGFSVSEDKEVYDYLYDADSLRTLKGKRFAKKRNHVNSFLKAYKGRWEYRRLSCNDRDDVCSFLETWLSSKKSPDEGGITCAASYSPEELLRIEADGIKELLSCPELTALVRAGGIYVDGRLSAFSIGGFNPFEKMAVIAVEKADVGFDGLYQTINREFLRNEFPDAKTVNREDDAGLPGLKKSKLSYMPTGFAKRYTIRQTDFI